MIYIKELLGGYSLTALFAWVKAEIPVGEENVCNTHITFEKNSQKRVDYFVALCENIEDDVLATKEHPIRYYIHLKGVSK